MKKIFSFLVITLLFAGFGVSAFAGTVTVNSAEGGSVAVSGPLSGDGGIVTLTAQPESGYEFTRWDYSTADGGAGSSTSITENFDIYDRWVQPVFTKVETPQSDAALSEQALFRSGESTGESTGESAGASAGGETLGSPATGTISCTITPAGSGSYAEAEGGVINGNIVKQLTAVPGAGYDFSHWITEDGSVYYDLTQYFDVTRGGEPVDRSLTLVFKAKSDESEIITPEPSTAYTAAAEEAPAGSANVYWTNTGSQVTFGIYSIDSDYSFIRWVINGTEYPYGQRTVAVKWDQNLYGVAQFVKNTATTYKISYKPDNANETYDLQPQYKNSSAPVVLYDSGYTRTGYVQTGWISTDSVFYPLGGFYNENADVTLLPYWEKAGKHYVTVYYNMNGGNIKTGSTLVKSGDRFLVPDDGSVTFTFNSAKTYYPSSAVLNGVSKTISNNALTVWGKGSDQILNVTFSSVYAPPQTGDSGDPGLWATLCVFSCAGLAVLGSMSRRASRGKSRG